MVKVGAKLSPCAEEGAGGSGAPMRDLGFRSVHVGCAGLGVLCEAVEAAVGLGLCWGDIRDLLASMSVLIF